MLRLVPSQVNVHWEGDQAQYAVSWPGASNKCWVLPVYIAEELRSTGKRDRTTAVCVPDNYRTSQPIRRPQILPDWICQGGPPGAWLLQPWVRRNLQMCFPSSISRFQNKQYLKFRFLVGGAHFKGEGPTYSLSFLYISTSILRWCRNLQKSKYGTLPPPTNFLENLSIGLKMSSIRELYQNFHLKKTMMDFDNFSRRYRLSKFFFADFWEML